MSTQMQPKRVLAFDPGFERLGIAVIERSASHQSNALLLYSDCLRTSSSLPLPKRLASLGESVEGILSQFSPDACASEEVFFQKNVKTAMGVAQVRGMLAYLAASRGLPVFEYTPLEVKVATTGYGGSGKKDIAAMLPRLMALPPKKRLDDEYDAIAIGLTCLVLTRNRH